jgi:CRISPR/Cas system CMR subunit Cmr6 (Cas7 group RAMP superfamily)
MTGGATDATLTELPLSFSQSAELPYVPSASLREAETMKGSGAA